MVFDSKILAKARNQIENIRLANEEETSLRKEKAEHDFPQLLEIDSLIQNEMHKLIRVSLSHGSNISSIVEGIKEKTTNLQMQKSELLVSSGLPCDYLDPIVSCKKCKDTGIFNGQKCECLIKAYNRFLTEELSPLLNNGNEAFESFDLLYYPDEFSSELSASPRQIMSAVLNYCQDYSASFPTDKNLLLQGNTGLGKTFLSACIARAISQKGYSICYSSVTDCLDAYEKMKFSRDASIAELSEAKVNQEIECDLLILDDLGTEIITSVSISALYNILNNRIIHKKPIIISTNLTDSELAAKYTSPVYSRLNGEFIKLPFYGNDIRNIKKNS